MSMSMSNDRFKFRHYNKLVKKMTYYDKPEMQVCLNNDFKSGLIFPMSEEYDDNAMYMGNYTYYQQCTGLKDKNGKLIYEGDIVHKSGSKFNGEKILSEVAWSDMTASFWYSDLTGIGGAHEFRSGTAAKMEVLGNIYENPELMEAK